MLINSPSHSPSLRAETVLTTTKVDRANNNTDFILASK